MSVLVADRYTSNADLILACRDLGYLDDEATTLDPTYGYGVFWSTWRPRLFVGCDIDPTKCFNSDPHDFRELDWPTGHFDRVVFDPPYKLNGTPSDCDERYGVHVPARWQDRMQLCTDGITECVRILKPGGYLLVKCMDQVVSGQKRWQTHIFARHAETLGCRLIDQLHLLTTPRPQPQGRRQVHAQQNYSTMLILQRGPQ